MAVKKTTGKIKSDGGGYIAPPGATNANRVSGAYSDEGMSLKQYFDLLYKQTSPQASPRSDALSGRTTEGGTRSVLEGFRAFIRGGGLRTGGK